MKNTPEILAPAGGKDSLIAAVNAGCDAVYLGMNDLSARQGAKNFDSESLSWAVDHCHSHGVKVYLAVNTLIFDEQFKVAQKVLKSACYSGVDALIIQDLGLLEFAKKSTTGIEFHASTQLAVHNLDGIKQAQRLGFSRVVLARELTFDEVKYICEKSPIETEVFVHGALCMSISGQCYLSGMLGQRSGNRGRCAQACRLPFKSGSSEFSLSLKDLSSIDCLPKLAGIGVTSFKIEGRLKRPEYVTASVTACRQSLLGEKPNYADLQNVFSRSGFTNGYIKNQIDDNMFGRRTKNDIQASEKLVSSFEKEHQKEIAKIPVSFSLRIKENLPAELLVKSADFTSRVFGKIPETAISSPTTYEKAKLSIEKTGGTPFYCVDFVCEIDDGLMIPVSQLNELRRKSLEELLVNLETKKSKVFTDYPLDLSYKSHEKYFSYRIRFENSSQVWDNILSDIIDRPIGKIILPIDEILKLNEDFIGSLKDKLVAELPRINFSHKITQTLRQTLSKLKEMGINSALCGNIGSIYLAQELDFEVHLDFSVNAVNSLACQCAFDMGATDLTMGLEYPYYKSKLPSTLPIGIVAYGYLPLMITRAKPAGVRNQSEFLTDRMGVKFRVSHARESWQLYNSLPLVLSDAPLTGFDFYTLYFTSESPEHCKQVLNDYLAQKNSIANFTRGLYRRKVV